MLEHAHAHAYEPPTNPRILLTPARAHLLYVRAAVFATVMNVLGALHLIIIQFYSMGLHRIFYVFITLIRRAMRSSEGQAIMREHRASTVVRDRGESIHVNAAVGVKSMKA